MAEFRMMYCVLFRSRRVRVSVTAGVSVIIESPTGLRSEIEHRGAERRRVPEADDHPELRAQWRALPKSIRPEEWVTETGVKHVPGSLLIAEAQRRPEGYHPAGG